MRLAASLPLPLLHAAGTMLGWLAYVASSRYRKRLRNNLAAAGYGADLAVRRDAIAFRGAHGPHA